MKQNERCVVKCLVDDYSFVKKGEDILFLGEISNMPTHGIFVDNKGKIRWGYHMDSFRKLRGDET